MANQVIVCNCTNLALQVTLNRKQLPKDIAAATYDKTGAIAPGSEAVPWVSQPMEGQFGPKNALQVQTSDGQNYVDYGNDVELPDAYSGMPVQMFLFFSMAVLTANGHVIWAAADPDGDPPANVVLV